MKHFSHRKEWIEQSAKYCQRCVNYIDRRDGRGKGCPVDDMHMEYDDLEALEIFNAEGLSGDYEYPQCSMFLERRNNE